MASRVRIRGSLIRVAAAWAVLGALSFAQSPFTVRVGVTSTEIQTTGPSRMPSFSADGLHVVFSSEAAGLVPGDTNGFADVFVHDRRDGTTSLVSVAADGEPGDGGSGYPSISSDGRYVAFWSAATNLVPGDTNDCADLFLHDRWNGTTSRVIVATVLDAPFDVDSREDGRPWIEARGTGADSPALVRFHSEGGERLGIPRVAPTQGVLCPPASFLLTAPLDGAEVVPTIPTSSIPLSWTASSGQDSYLVEIARDSSFNPITYSADLDASATSHDVPAGLLQFFRVYSWRVRATNSAGTTTASNAPFQFTIVSPPGSFPDPNPGDCFVATAAYGSPMEPEVETLRAFRDRVLLPTAPGRAFVAAYYRCSPPLAAAIAERPAWRKITRALLWPVVRLAESVLWGADHPIGAGALACAILAFASLVARVVRRWRRCLAT